MDEQGGEKIEILADCFGFLLNDARERNLLRDDFYHLSDSVLRGFKMFQGFDPLTEFPGYRLEQAYLIWQQCPQQTLKAVLEANGFFIPDESPIPGTMKIYFTDESGH